jgi:glycosyltransferase involved in cell wall biosynthesis
VQVKVTEISVDTSSGPAISPAVTVIIPFYNRARFVASAVRTLECQTFKDFELVVVDDGSQDDLAAGIRSIRTPICIRLLQLSQNCGAASARNAGIDAARGRYVAFLDSDDAWESDKLRQQAAHLERATDSDRLVSLTRQLVVGARTYVVPRRLFAGNESVGRYLFQSGGVIQTSMMFMTTGLARSVRFPDGGRGHDDWSFALRLEKAGARFEMLPQVLTVYNDAPGRARRSPAYSHERFQWLEQWRPQLGEAPYFAARAAFAANMGEARSREHLGMIADACLRRAIPPWRAAYYTANWFFPSLRTICLPAWQTWLSLRRLPRPVSPKIGSG